MSNDRAKRHHFVPREYLRGFANGREMLSTHDLKTGRRFPQAVRTAAAVNGFYEVMETTGEKSDLVERDLAKLEGPALGALNRVLAGEFPVTGATREWLAFLIAFQQVRIPKHRSMFNAVADHILKLEVAANGPEKVRQHLQQGGRDVTDQEVAELWDSLTDFDEYIVTPHQNQHIQMALQLTPETATLISSIPWALVTFDHRRLLTSDCPVGLYQREDNRDPMMGVGLVNADEIWFPMSRTTALLISPHATDGSRLNPTVNLSKHINFITAASADRWLYFHPDDDPTDGIELRRDQHTPNISGITPQELAKRHSPAVPSAETS